MGSSKMADDTKTIGKKICSVRSSSIFPVAVHYLTLLFKNSVISSTQQI